MPFHERRNTLALNEIINARSEGQFAYSLYRKWIFPAYSGSFCDPILLNALSMAAFLAFSSA